MSTVSSVSRRHDLDALRAAAMLLGIALHACLSFLPFPWPVQDVNQNMLFALFFTSVHGFRMQLFFLVSGFFTAMLWRQRGLSSLLKHRTQRILLPCMLGLITIVPALDLASRWAMRTTTDAVPPLVATDLILAVRIGDREKVEEMLAEGADVNKPDSTFQAPPLTWAALHGRVEIAEILLVKGAKINVPTSDGSTPLHSAAFLGRADMAELLLEKGADPRLRNNKGELPIEAAAVDSQTTRFIAGLLQVPVDDDRLKAGRERVKRLLREHDGEIKADEETSKDDDIRSRYMALISSHKLQIQLPWMEEPIHLVHTPFFHHLWFLWFLCWLVAFFAVYASLADAVGFRGAPAWLVVSPARMIWLLPLTLLPQLFMGLVFPTFGPDTSVGVLPQPHVLLYYAVFFGFGALYYDCDDSQGRLGAWWWFTIPFAIVIAFPIGLIGMSFPWVGGPAQVVYAWCMTLGLIGLFRAAIGQESRAMRYMSDASYWLYLAHVPLVIVAQNLIRDWSLWSFGKFFLITTVVTGVLLISYEYGVRYTWLGRMLNGPRRRPGAEDATDAAIPEVEGEGSR